MIDLAQLERDGFTMGPSLLSIRETEDLVLRLEAVPDRSAMPYVPRRGGIRDVMEHVPQLRAVARHPAVREVVESTLGEEGVVVRSTLFDKTVDANWKVPWHQDVTISVQERRDIPGYGPWSLKEGIMHVQPPTHVLQKMITIRIHLDPCPEGNGALRVLPGTHRFGRLNQNEVPLYVKERHAVTCEARIGDALIMRPLLLHASSASTTPGHRRVLHFDFANATLANDLEWRLR